MKVVIFQAQLLQKDACGSASADDVRTTFLTYKGLNVEGARTQKSQYVKSNVIPVHAMKACGGNEGTGLCTLNRGSRQW